MNKQSSEKRQTEFKQAVSDFVLLLVKLNKKEGKIDNKQQQTRQGKAGGGSCC